MVHSLERAANITGTAQPARDAHAASALIQSRPIRRGRLWISAEAAWASRAGCAACGRRGIRMPPIKYRRNNDESEAIAHHGDITSAGDDACPARAGGEPPHGGGRGHQSLAL